MNLFSNLLNPSFNKDLKRSTFLGVQLFSAIVILASVLGIVVFSHDCRLTYICTPMLVRSLFTSLALYFSLVSITNVVGRLRNISNRDIWLLFGLYLVSSLFGLSILIFFLPPGFFDKKDK